MDQSVPCYTHTQSLLTTPPSISHCPWLGGGCVVSCSRFLLPPRPTDSLSTTGMGQLQILPPLSMLQRRTRTVRRCYHSFGAHRLCFRRSQRELLLASPQPESSPSRLSQNFELAPVAWALVFFMGVIFGLSIGLFASYHLYLAARNR